MMLDRFTDEQAPSKAPQAAGPLAAFAGFNSLHSTRASICPQAHVVGLAGNFQTLLMK